MTDAKFHEGWYQVRLFTNVLQANRFANLLGRVIKPFVDQRPSVRLFFSQYYCPFGVDDGDTVIANLPQEFHLQIPSYGLGHASVRIRFRERQDEQAALTAIINEQPDFWYSGMTACTPEGVLPPDRFSTDQDVLSRSRRIRLIAELLHANCRLVLNNLRFENGTWDFQVNDHAENQRLGSVVKSIEHMILNVWCRKDGAPFPIYGFDPQTIYQL